MTKVTVAFKHSLAKELVMAATQVAITKVTIEAMAMLRIELNKPGSGIEYSRGKGRVHRASAPGEPPAPDVKDLQRSVDFDIIVTDKAVTGVVGTRMEYSAALHLGTEKMKARPFADAPIKGSNLKRLNATFRREFK